MQKVLLIDDEEGIRESLSVMLQIEGYKVTALPDAINAVQMLESGESYDYIISDIKMPQMDRGMRIRVMPRQRACSTVVT